MTDIAGMNLKDLAAAIKRRKVSSLEVTKALIARIDQWQPTLNAFARVEAEDALKSAKAADRALAAGKAKGPLHGVPLAHKDMYYSKGKLAECGSKIRKGWIAPATATAVERLEAAGSFRLGAVNMVEFAYGPTGHNVHTGNVYNPWSTDCITGGSSSGSGSAVAARLLPAALGSDTGGSIRMPAHFCGVSGFKPTNNRVSRANAMPLSFTLDTVGPLAQTAEDCAIVLSIIAGPDPLDPTTATAPKWDAKAMKRPAKGLHHRHSEELLCRRSRTGCRQGARRRDRDLQEARREGRAGRSAGPGDGLGRRHARARRRGRDLSCAVAAHATG